MTLTPKVSGGQVIATLIICRLFILMIFVPTTHRTVSTNAAFLVIITGALLTLAASIPAVLLLKNHKECSLLDCAGNIAPRLRWPFAFLFFLVCLAVATESAGQFEYFITTAVYPQAKGRMVILLFCLVAWYMVFLGIEAISRASGVILTLVCVTFGVICFNSLGQIDTLNLISPFYDGWEEILYGSVLYFAQNIELVLWLLLLPYAKGHWLGKSFLWYNGVIVLILEIVSFFTLTVMGTYGQTRIFPVYTLSAVSDTRFFYRLDYFYILIWTFVALFRTAIYVYFLAKLLHIILPQKVGDKLGKKAMDGLAVAAVACCTFFTAKETGSFEAVYRVIASGLPVFLLIMVAPTVLLGLEYHEKRKEAQGNEGEN